MNRPTRSVGDMEKKMKKVLVIVLLLASGYAMSHGGGKDANGCHTESKTGAYHCH